MHKLWSVGGGANTNLKSKHSFFYGYWILIPCFLSLFTSAGLAGYTFGLFVSPLQDEFGWGRGSIMLGSMMRMGIQVIASPFVGRVVDRYGPKRVIIFGSLVQAFAFVLLSMTGNLLLFLACQAIVGIGYAGMFTVPVTGLISRWFKKRRGWALGISAIGVGVGGLAAAPLVGGYVIPGLGWREAYLVLAAATILLVVPLALLVIKSQPSDVGQRPDGAGADDVVTATSAKPDKETAPAFTLKTAVRTQTFWLIATSYLTWGFVTNGVFQNHVPHLIDIKFTAAIAAATFGVVGAGSAIGKFGFGWISDYIKPKYAYCIGILFVAAGVGLLMKLSVTSPSTQIWLYAAVFGIGIGAFLPCISMIVSDSFGLLHYGLIYGVLTSFYNVGTSTGAVMAGYIYDATGSYNLSFIIFLVLLGVSFGSILLVRKPKTLPYLADAIPLVTR